jgi:hypothetical protein
LERETARGAFPPSQPCLKSVEEQRIYAGNKHGARSSEDGNYKNLSQSGYGKTVIVSSAVAKGKFTLL